MRIPFLALACVLAFAAPLAAQQDTGPAAERPIAPSHLAAAREYLDLLGMAEIALVSVEVSLEQQIRAAPALKPYRAVMMEWARDVFASEESKDAFATAYAETFSEAEIRELIAFARTPLGRRLFENQADLARKGAEIGRRLAEARQADLLERLERVQPTTKPR